MKGAKAKPEDVVVPHWLPWWAQATVGLGGLVYLVMLGLSTIPRFAVPFLFLQMAALFPKATDYSFEYRVEGWVCGENRFQELDYRRWFPMRPDDKENRFQRLGYFYISRPSRPVLRALDAWLVEHHNGAATPGDGIDGKIGGVRLMSLRIPVPKPSGEIARYHWQPLDAFPEEQRKIWYYSPNSMRRDRCKAAGVDTTPPPTPPQPEREPPPPESSQEPE